MLSSYSSKFCFAVWLIIRAPISVSLEDEQPSDTITNGRVLDSSGYFSRPLTKFEARGHRLGHGVWDIKYKRVK